MRLAFISGILCGLLLVATEAFARKAWWILVPYAALIVVMAVWGKGRFGSVFVALLISTAILYLYVATRADIGMTAVGHLWRIAALVATAALCSAVAAVAQRQIS